MKGLAVAPLLFAAALAHAQDGGPRWQSIRSQDGKYTFSMPAQPVYKTQTRKAKNGSPVRYAVYTVDLGKSAYMISTSDYDSETRISLDAAIDGVLGSWESPRAVQRKETPFSGHSSQSVDFASGRYRIIVRAIIVGRRLYQLGFVETMDQYVPAHSDRFLSSFRLR